MKRDILSVSYGRKSNTKLTLTALGSGISHELKPTDKDLTGRIKIISAKIFTK